MWGQPLRMHEGDIIDIGAESTRPSFEALSREEEAAAWSRPSRTVGRSCRRVLISADTFRSETARATLDSGADITNDR